MIEAPARSATPPAPDRATVEASGSIRPAPNRRPSASRLERSDSLAADYVGKERLRRQLAGPDIPARPTALATDDFDEDGIPDLVSGFSGSSGHLIALHRGNVDAIFPHGPAARQHKAAGTFTDAPFLTPARIFETPVSPEFVAAGDFDNDGHRDVVVARHRGRQLWLLPGDGRGGFGDAREVALAGEVTALVGGEINRRDGLADLAVGLGFDEGGAVLVFEGPAGALSQAPERIDLGVAPTALALGRLDDAWPVDLAVAAGGELLILHGRDRMLTVRKERRTGVGPAVVESIAQLDGSIVSVAIGDLVWDDLRLPELALMTADGKVRLLGRTRDADSGWRTVGERGVTGSASAASRLVTARVSGLPLDELVVLDGAVAALHLMLGEVGAEGEAEPDDLGRPETKLLAGRPVAALPMRLDAGPLDDLVLLEEGQRGPAIMATPLGGLIVVDDVNDSGPLPGDGSCQLSEAITNANLNSETSGGDCGPGLGAGDSIEFLVSGVSVTANLPPMTDLGDIIDGTGAGCVDIQGALGVGPGLELSGTSTVRGLAVSGFSGNGIEVRPPGIGNIIEGNHLGLDCSGSTAGNTSAGILVVDAPGTTIGGTAGPLSRNVAASNGIDGISILELLPGSSAGTTVEGNFIGTDPSGTVGLGNGATGIFLDSADSLTVGGTTPGAGNLVSGNTQDGVRLFPGLDTLDFNLIQGNLVGTDVSGTLAIANGASGVHVSSGISNTIGGTAIGAGNVASGNSSSGVLIDRRTIGPSTDTLVQGNLVGTDISGALPLGNGDLGIVIFDSPANTIGGSAPGAGNVASANRLFGIAIANFAFPGATDGNVVQGNIVGLDATGAFPVGVPGIQTASGIIVQDSSFSIIGGRLPGEGNVSAANGENGIFVNRSIHPAPTDNIVRGNRLGTNITGTVAIPNGFDGVTVQDASFNTIGGVLPGEGNLLSGNDSCGVFILEAALVGSSTGNTVEGNIIGLDAGGGSALPNAACGVAVQDASFNTIGGALPGAGNTIQGNDGPGVVIVESLPQPTTGNSVLGNSVFANTPLGIDLAADGVTPNDPTDPDPGPNLLQNFPVITRADVGMSETVIEGTLNSSPSSSFRVELFASPICSPSGFGEGRDFLDAATVATDPAGDGTFEIIVPGALTVGDAVTATATDDGTGNTSEFSACFAASPCVLTAFGQTVLAADKDFLEWSAPVDTRFVRGALSAVSSYGLFDAGALTGATELDISLDDPVVGAGIYYLLRLTGCGTYQTMVGAEPGRDTLP